MRNWKVRSQKELSDQIVNGYCWCSMGLITINKEKYRISLTSLSSGATRCTYWNDMGFSKSNEVSGFWKNISDVKRAIQVDTMVRAIMEDSGYETC